MNLESLRFVPLLLGISLIAAGCKSRNNSGLREPAAEVPPAEYDEFGREVPGSADRPGGRFGYSGDESAQVPSPPPPAPRDVRDVEPAAPDPPKKKEPSNSKTNMPYANKVPGKPLVVTLPGSSTPISIEKYDSAGNPTGEPLARGTQVQIPDPNNPGQKIYFKVP